MTIRFDPFGANLRRLILATAAGLLPLVPVGAPAQDGASGVVTGEPPATGDALAAATLQLQSAPPSAPEVVTTKPANDQTASAPRVPSSKPAPPAGLSTAQIIELQTNLGELGYTSVGPDGYIDGDTIEAFNLWRSETGRSPVRSIGLGEYYEFKQEISQ